ncbi:MAG: hypothetical protein ABW146_20110, partial [Candidatus Sedimenticola sp. 6PFRAG7]
IKLTTPVTVFLHSGVLLTIHIHFHTAILLRKRLPPAVTPSHHHPGRSFFPSLDYLRFIAFG